MSFRVLDPDDGEWGDVLARVPHDVYHLAGYARLAETQEALPVRLAVVERDQDVLVAPFMPRELPAELGAGFDITTPYGYPGPVSSAASLERQQELVSELVSGFAAMGALSMFVRLHPLIGVDAAAFAPFGELVVHGDQVVIELGETDRSDIVSSFRADHRRNIRILRERDFTLRVDDERDFQAFPDAYLANMARLNADSYYWFGIDYFRVLSQELGAESHMVTAVSPDGEAVAYALFFVVGELAQYHLSATDSRFLSLAPSKLSILGMAEVCRSLGVRSLNLGGGVGGRADSLLEFKAGFSRLLVPFATARLVFDEGRYRVLSRDVASSEDFFPAYRAQGAAAMGSGHGA